jgi:preprotein translocase subunit SecB
MDTTKQPGITIKSIILAESHFQRKPVIPDDTRFDVNFEVQNSINEDNTNLSCMVTATLNKPGDPVFLKVVYVGVFTVNDEPNMDLEEFGKVNAPAILFPYVREEIHNRTMKGSLPRRFILQPLNIKAALNSDD